mmetsp:Transcript_40155/g.92286  ORF Transcript_40155/g.92286 Transcript_40155/m.92286 type:complete len:248 (+) Transcript_40155:70-813(+)
MPSALKARAGKKSAQEMKADLSRLRKPPARTVEEIFRKYHNMCVICEPRLYSIDVTEPDINWRSLVMSLPQPISQRVLGCGLKKVVLQETDCVYEGIYRFHAERLDGSRAAFDWREAYDDPYHNYKDKSFKHDVDTAMRAAVLPHLIEYKEIVAKDQQMELCSHISGIALPWERAVVQHFPTTFESLVDAFLNEMQMHIEQIKLEFCDQHAYKLKDVDLREKWQAYHRSHAHYRIISTDEAMEQENL